MREASETAVFRFMHGKLITAVQAGREGEAAAWAWMLGHYAARWESKRGRLRVVAGLDMHAGEQH